VTETSESRKSRSGDAGKEKKTYTKKALSLLWSFLGVAALVASCLGTWSYMKKHDLVQKKTITSKTDRDNLDIKPYHGTYLAKKSNSLDGVPFYIVPGGTEQGGLFPEGKCIEVMEYTQIHDTRWIHAAYCGLDGWLEERFVRNISEKSLYIQVGTKVYVNAMTEKGIKGYAEPGMGSEVVQEGILYGEEYTVEELSRGWGRVTDQGKSFWLNMYFMGSYPSEYWKVESLRSSQGINLRKEPDEHTKSLGKVPENQPVKILEFSRGWGRVVYEGQSGWLKLNYMSPDKVPDQS